MKIIKTAVRLKLI